MPDSMKRLYHDLIKNIGEDPTRDGLQLTPKRAADALRFLTSGYTKDLSEVINGAIFDSASDETIFVTDIDMYSLCEHHLLPFFGRVHVAYVPNGRIIGLSKIPRIVDMYSRRLQIQERLTCQIATTLMDKLRPHGVGVVVEARHLCAMMRGVRKQRALMRTTCMLGTFRTSNASRAELFNLIR